MGRILSRFRAFWSAEEIPRWFGLSLLVLFIGAVGAVSYYAYRHSRDYAFAQTTHASEDALDLLAGLIRTDSQGADPVDQTLLHRFARSQRCSELRIYDRDLRVIASLLSSETGQTLRSRSELAQARPADLISSTLSDAGPNRRQVLVRVPVRSGGNPPQHYLEAVFDLDGPIALLNLLQAGSLLIALVGITALLAVYHRLRTQFRSVARIAGNLSDAENVEDRLEDLRINDTQDALATGWNSLLDLAISLKEEVARSAASTELLTAISTNAGGELAEAMGTVPLGVMLLAEQGEVCYANAMIRRLFGWDGEVASIMALSDDKISADGAAVAEVVRSAQGVAGAMRATERRIEGADGSYYNVQVVPVLTQRQLRRCVVLVLDVSQQVRADVAREEFVSQVTHELRTPLTNIRAYAETLSSGMFDDPKVITECYNVITKETRRLSRLIEDILSISQLEVGTMQLVLDQVDLRELITECVRDVRGIAESKEIDLQVVLPPKLDPVRLDRDKIAVVINNLLGNALKYSRSGAQVVVSCKANEGEVRLSVKDTGIGIDEKDHDRIFEKFQRSDDPDVQGETGTGIGLTTAREIVRHHGGDISLLSKKGEGSTFTVHLPLEKRAAAPSTAAR